jgi:hypothetical protein
MEIISMIAGDLCWRRETGWLKASKYLTGGEILFMNVAAYKLKMAYVRNGMVVYGVKNASQEFMYIKSSGGIAQEYYSRKWEM